MYIVYCIGDRLARKVRLRSEKEVADWFAATSEGTDEKVTILDIIPIS